MHVRSKKRVRVQRMAQKIHEMMQKRRERDSSVHNKTTDIHSSVGCGLLDADYQPKQTKLFVPVPLGQSEFARFAPRVQPLRIGEGGEPLAMATEVFGLNNKQGKHHTCSRYPALDCGSQSPTPPVMGLHPAQVTTTILVRSNINHRETDWGSFLRQVSPKPLPSSLAL
jgi:hypothetical protein